MKRVIGRATRKRSGAVADSAAVSDPCLILETGLAANRFNAGS
jgi:hypothetical protein